jgi:hypothetical protein
LREAAEIRRKGLISGLTNFSETQTGKAIRGGNMTIGFFCYAKTAFVMNCHPWFGECFFLNSPFSNFRSQSRT